MKILRSELSTGKTKTFKIQNENGMVVTVRNDTLKAIENFCKKLYSLHATQLTTTRAKNCLEC